ncbi:MAG: site-specific DNA-methyltransferase, partial [Ruminococcus sp.]
MSNVELHCGDCLDILPSIPGSSIDLILCDLPYGSSVVHKWNKALPLERLWKEYERLIKPDGVICLF